MPELCNDAASSGMDGIRDASPAANLLLCPEPWCIGPAESLRTDSSGLGNDQSRRSTLRVILSLQDCGHVIVRSRTHPGERRHDDGVREIDVSHSLWCKNAL